MNKTIKTALRDTLAVLGGYMVLGFGFGILMHASGFHLLHTLLMSLFIYAGSMQFAAVGLMTGGASLLTAAVTTLMVNARHIFYGISMLEKYQHTGKAKPYLIFGLTDETYSLVCRETEMPDEEKKRYYRWVTALDHVYWVTGSLMGAAVGTMVQFNTEGIDFSLTALFLTVFLEQWLTKKDHAPALMGVLISLICLLIFGSEHFLIPAMLVIALLLCLYTGREAKERG